ncbi:MAG: 3-dehydroquinate synthase [Phycisphaerales bacterium]|nr:3-dehydroquinate synthase [Phycisphaerales bacterium]
MTSQHTLDGEFTVAYRHRVRFERDALTSGTALAECLATPDAEPARTIAVLDAGLVDAAGNLPALVKGWFEKNARVATLSADPMVLPGSEAAKDGLAPVVEPLLASIARGALCRRSNVLAIGGGAFLDAASLAASLAHRGLRCVRMPTTTLAQGDAGIGVKNGVNLPGLPGPKNLMGTFDVPSGVVNDPTLLATLDDVHWRSGLAESIKVALVKDVGLLGLVESSTDALLARDLDAMEAVLIRTAELHVRHITEGGDPFEAQLARPLDFGHWIAHELEVQSHWLVPHGEAVALGMMVDLHLGESMGITAEGTADRVDRLLRQLGFLSWRLDSLEPSALMSGLEHFRQHLGGQLTICMIETPGRAVDIHAVDLDAARAAVECVCGNLVGR